jgi:O-antigen ligase
MPRPQFLTRETNALILAGLVGTGIGLLTPIAVELATSGKNLWLALAPLMVPVLLLMAMRPVLGAAAFIAFSFVNPSSLPPLIEVGPLTLRYVDGVFCLFVCMVLARSVIGRRTAILTEVRELFVPLLIFLLYIGLSLVVVRISAPNSIGASVASYLRLLLTASFVPVLCVALRDKWDIQFFNKALIFFSMATVAVGVRLVWAGGAEAFAARSGGVLGIGPLGLVSGLLVLYALIERDGNPWSMVWIFSLAAGLLGLYLAKTVSAAFAVAVTATVYFASMRSRRFDLLRWAVVGTIMMTAAALAIWTARQSDVSGVSDVSGGSFAERIMIGYAGLQVFLDNPLIGVGWQASTAEVVIGTRALTAVLMENFGQLPTDYFSQPPTSLHNMYIQFLAELGIIGFALFVWVCFRTGKSVARILKNTPHESPYRVPVQFYSLGLIYLLIWWNNSALFGGQIETTLAFSFLALLANVAQLERQRAEQSPVIHRNLKVLACCQET